jgi:SAM-dependent methyltransferase
VVALWRHEDGLAQPVAGDEAFDVAAEWRCEAILRLGLTDGVLETVASPSPVSRQLLEFVVRHVGAAPDGPVVDVGAGLAGIAETVRRSLGRPVVAFDGSWGACAGARRLFPEVWVARANPFALPVRGHAVPAAVACGLLSATDDLAPVFAEVFRVMMPEGRFAVIDLVSASSHSVRVGSRVYPPAEGIAGRIVESGFELVDEAIAHTSLSDWALEGEQVAREVARTRRGDMEFEHWLDGRRRLERVMSSDRIVIAGFAARPTRSGTNAA